MNDNVNNDMTVDIPAADIPAVCAGYAAADIPGTGTLVLSPIGSGDTRPAGGRCRTTTCDGLALSPIGSGDTRPGCRRRRGDLGEGVISAAIAVLIVAFLGAAMWVGFNTIWDNAEDDITQQVNRIGSNQ